MLAVIKSSANTMQPTPVCKMFTWLKEEIIETNLTKTGVIAPLVSIRLSQLVS